MPSSSKQKSQAISNCGSDARTNLNNTEDATPRFTAVAIVDRGHGAQMSQSFTLKRDAKEHSQGDSEGN